MKYYFCKLHPPRPTFAFDLTESERNVMKSHGAYWGGMMAKGQVIVFGPVGDPSGPFGMGVLELPDDGDAKALADADPAILSGLGFRYEIHPMLSAVVRR